MKDWPFPHHPTGWFQIAWSDEVPPGGVHPVRCFDRDLVVYRGESTDVHVLDAHCPHMGAHLGYGGCAECGVVSTRSDCGWPSHTGDDLLRPRLLCGPPVETGASVRAPLLSLARNLG